MIKPLFLTLLSFLLLQQVFAQQPRAVSGTVTDSLGVLPGINVKLISDKDSAIVATDSKGIFQFPAVQSQNFKLTVTGLGYQAITKRYTIDNDTKLLKLDPIKLKIQINLLNLVNIIAINPITIKEDTVEYKAAAYKVREGSPVEDLIKKMPGITIDKDGNVTAHGKQVTKVRVNGKDYFSGDVQTATQNLPADIVENIQVIDDYGDQANLTGIKTGEPNKILNITIQKGKRTGKFGQATVGAGNDNRYVAKLSANTFKEDRQIAVIGTLNNTNTNSFNLATGGGGGGGRGGRGGGGDAGGGISTANGITTNRSIGFNYRNEWGKKITAYGSYSFADRDKLTTSTSQQKNLFQGGTIINNDNSIGHSNNINHRFDFNIEYRIDTANYLKINPNFSYNSSNTTNTDTFSNTRNNTQIAGHELSITNASSPSGGLSLLYNHKFKKKGRNFSINTGLSFSKNMRDLDEQYITQPQDPTVPPYQQINTNNSSMRGNVNLSYTEPIGKTTYLEANYAYNYSKTDNNRYNYSVDPISGAETYVDSLSTIYNYQFITNRFGINLRGIHTKYNYTLGMAVQPATLNGESHNFATSTNTFNYIPTARFIYNFKKNHSLSINYSGTNNQPSFTQLQIQPDFSNPQNRVYGNPDLKPEFNNNISLRYNQFDIASGNSLFTNLSFTSTQNKIVTSSRPLLIAGSIDSTKQETHFLNTNGFYSANGNYAFSKPFVNRKYTVTLNGGANFSNNINYIEGERDQGKNWVFNQGAKLRVDLDSLMDTEISGNYSINTTRYSQSSISTDAKTWTFGLDGRNYFFNNLVLGYNLTQTINHGFSSTVKANPTLLSTYVEYQFIKNHLAALRFQAFDIFNQNTGVSRTVAGNQIIDTRTNRLGRYFMLSFTLRLQKFAGKQGGFRNNGGGGRKGGGGGGRRG
jgi:hypothetical protein